MAKIIFNNKNYNIDESALAPAMAALEAHLRSMAGGADPEPYVAGLYRKGVLIKSWDELVSSGAIVVNDGAISVGSVIPELPAKNEYGFYYGVLYNDEDGAGYVFYEDGSVEQYDLYDTEKLMETYPAGYVEYSTNSIYFPDWNWRLAVSSDGLTLEDTDWGSQYALGSAYQFDGELLLPEDGRVTSISNYAFQCQTALTSVKIPEGVIIGMVAFGDCIGLTSIIFAGTVDQWNAIEKGERWDANTGNYTVYCTDGNIAKVPQEE